MVKRSPYPGANKQGSPFIKAGRYSQTDPTPRQPQVAAAANLAADTDDADDEAPASDIQVPVSDISGATRAAAPGVDSDSAATDVDESGVLGATRRDPLIDTVVAGDYRVLTLLQDTAVAHVYRAEHSRTRRPLVLKVLSPELSEDHRAVARFDREAEALAALEHPNIVQVVDFNQTADGRPFLAMELLEGNSLEFVLEGPDLLPLDEVTHLTTQIASALGYAHRHGLIHADLRAHNVFLARAGRTSFVKLLDFGMSRRIEQETDQQLASLRLTSLAREAAESTHLAPEQIDESIGPISARTDQFALACMVYEMLAGQAPFSAPHPDDVRRRILSDEPAPPSVLRPSLPPPLDNAILRALSKNPDHRFDKVADFAQIIALCDSDGISDNDSGAFELTTPPPARNPQALADTLGDGDLLGDNGSDGNSDPTSRSTPTAADGDLAPDTVADPQLPDQS